MRLKVGAATSIGRVRQINEDAFLAKAEEGLFVVCDGMGGAAAGEVASQLAVETIGASLAETSPVRRSPEGEGGNPGGNGNAKYRDRTLQLGEAVREANRAIISRARANASQAGMGTTVVGAWVDAGLVSLAHVGDSRAYLANASGFEGVTSDHSLVEAQVQAGLINRQQSLRSEHQNILLRALGRDENVEIDLGEFTVATGDRLVLCTDGLTRMVSDAELAAALDRFRGEPQQACDFLVEAANNNGGPDNITVVIVEFVESRLSSVLGRFMR
ncbi:MAG TPA: Stp1/IreP family PP2C-type Ser/Thr phosphatase [Vicinamibacterales bacterium]|nr:Stp1/IreP family PP2C-type Ser/Thr phosphatase [Vicinamibacterales bacterium]